MSLKTKAYKFTALSLLLAPMALSTFQGVTVMATDHGTENPAPESTKIPVTLHKLLNTNKFDVQNTGDIMTADKFYTGDTPKMIKLPGVTFAAYDITTVYYRYRAAGMTVKTAVEAIELLSKTFTVEANGSLMLQNELVAESAVETQKTDSNGEANFSNLEEKSGDKDAVYIFMEIDAPSVVTQKADPMVLVLPAYKYGTDGKITDEKLTEINLYPKNRSQLGDLYADKVIRSLEEKDGSTAVTDKALDGATFVVHAERTDIHNYDPAEDAIFLGYADENTGVRPWVKFADAEPFTTKDGGKLTVPGLAKGNYLLSETSTADGDNAYAGNATVFNKAFTIDLVVDEGKTYDVEFTGNDKLVNDDITIIKDNESASYQYGEVIEYTAETLIPGGMNYEVKKDGVLSPYYTEYSFTDTHNQWLVLDERSIVIKADGTVIPSSAYAVAVDDTNPEFVISFNNPKATLGQYANKKLEIAYNMSIKGRESNENGAPADVNFINEITAKSNFDEGTDEGNDVFTGGRKFIKVDGHSGAELKGAKFNISDAAENGNLLYVDGSGNYKFLNEAAEGYTLVELTSDDNGLFEIQGLKYGTYHLQEIAVPDSTYILPDGRFEFVVEAGSYENSEDFNKVSDEEQKIKNFSKGTLPSTGGMGTIVFFLVGAVAMTGVVAVSRKKKA